MPLRPNQKMPLTIASIIIVKIIETAPQITITRSRTSPMLMLQRLRHECTRAAKPLSIHLDYSRALSRGVLDSIATRDLRVYHMGNESQRGGEMVAREASR